MTNQSYLIFLLYELPFSLSTFLLLYCYNLNEFSLFVSFWFIFYFEINKAIVRLCDIIFIVFPTIRFPNTNIIFISMPNV